MSTDEKTKSKVTALGGICAVMEKMRRKDIPRLFDEQLGERVKQARYSFSDAFLGWMYCNLCGAKRLEDIYTENFAETFKDIPIAKLCSPDNLARIFKRFATQTEKHKSKSKGSEHIEHEFNRNPKMNDLLLAFAKSLGLLNENEEYLIDYDGTTIPSEKSDSKITYKGFKGYSPAVSMIGKIPVCIEARNGNTSASYKVKEALDHLFEMLEKNKIKTWGIRMDAASYQKDIINRLNKLGKKFYIRVSNTESMLSEIKIASWREIDLHKRTESIGEFEFFPFDDKHKYRIVVTKVVNSAPEQHRKKDVVYRAIITNDMEKQAGKYLRSDIEVVRLYDLRGDSENNFRDLLNDFNWKRPPFRNMNENLVYMYVSAMAKCLYEYLSQSISPMFIGLANVKLKKFIAKFIKQIVTVWQKENEDWTFTLFNSRQRFDDLQSWAVRK